ncbi:hypothetical protein [Halobaculum marinum]|uniref:Holin-X, holin superfamily III n=1 Tax=Halobaculum marinum TaxID=3031996 RepID=A0ABD5WW06_9EURY|nr:hypothetical protein [Halobaculum sp. DT55]
MPSTDDRDAAEVTATPDEQSADDGDAADLTAADVERIARRVAREELDRADRSRDSSLWTVLAGVFVGFAVLLPLSALVLSSLLDLGLPVEAVGALGLLAFLALVAYGWRFPPFQ